MRPKLAIVASHPIQHFVPVYRQLVERGQLDLKVFYLAENGVKNSLDADFGVSFSWDIPLLEGYSSEFVTPGKVVKEFSFFALDSSTLNNRIRDFNPDFVWLNGYSALANWRVLAGRHRAPVIYSSDSNLLDQRSWLKKTLKQAIVRLFLSRCAYFIAVSSQNKRYLQHYGVDQRRIFSASYPIDMTRLQAQRDQLTESDRQQLRKNYGIPADAFVLIFSGKLIPHKCPADLVLALPLVNQHKQRSGPVHVLFMGDGEQNEYLSDLAQKLGVADQVVIAGFINQMEIAKHMAAADVLALPSSKEPFGAVVSEALPFGLPIIASDRIGAVGESDSAQPQRNALVYPVGNIEKLAQSIITLHDDTMLYKAFSEHSRQIVAEHDVTVYCAAIEDIVASGSR